MSDDLIQEIESLQELPQDPDQAQALRGAAWEALRAAWEQLRADYDRLAGESVQAAEGEALAWDFARLAFLVEEIKAAARMAPDLAAFQLRYQRAAQSGDLHLIRAWHTVGPALVVEHWPKDGAALIERLTTDATRLWQPKAGLWLEEVRALVEQGRRLQAVTRKAHDLFSAGQDLSEFSGLLAGVLLEPTEAGGWKLIITD